MKLIENNWWLSKQVRYKGNLLIVPVWTNWVATEADGKILAFEEEPFIDGFGSGEEWWEVRGFFSELMVVGKAELELNEDWKESLIYVGEEQ